jgi:hypothetical protein
MKGVSKQVWVKTTYKEFLDQYGQKGGDLLFVMSTRCDFIRSLRLHVMVDLGDYRL